MPSFSYTARDAQGRSQQGALEAASTTAVVDDLRSRGWLVLDVRDDLPTPAEEGLLALANPARWLPARSIDVELSLRQMAVMLRSGLTLLNALIAVAENAQRRAMGRMWNEVAGRIQEGASLAEAMNQHRRFSPVVVQMVRVGEETGELEPILTRAADVLEHRRMLLASILTALAYPAIVLLAAVGVSAFMVVSLIPKLERFLSTIGRQLPAMTQLLLDISRWSQQYGVHLLLALVLCTAAWIVVYCWPPGRLWIDRNALRVPLIGTLFRLSATVSFAAGLAALLRSGITLLEALRTVEHLQRNRYLALQVAGARETVIRGGNLAGPLTTGCAFMPLLSRMVAVGEAAGTLDEVLQEVAKFYEAQLQATIRRLSVIIEPVIIVVVGGIVGFVYISFFMALFAAGGAH